MWTVRGLLIFTLQLKEHLEEYPRLLESVPLLLIYLRKSVKDQCLPAGVLGREILTVLTMVYAGNLEITHIFSLLTYFFIPAMMVVLILV